MSCDGGGDFLPCRPGIGDGGMTYYLSVVSLVVTDTVRACTRQPVFLWLFFCFMLVLVIRFFIYMKRGRRK